MSDHDDIPQLDGHGVPADARLAAKDAQIAALKGEVLKTARPYVKEEVEYGACAGCDRDALKRIAAALEMSGGVL